MDGKSFLRATLGLSLAWTASLFVAPLFLEPGTVTGLHGRANFLDYPDLWASMPLFERTIYTLGDLNCHQMMERSWLIHGNQMPVDVRMAAGFLLGNVGFWLALRAPSLLQIRDGAAQLLPPFLRRRLDGPAKRLAFLALAWTVALAPAMVDVGAQLVSSYESTNALRFATGAWLGVFAGFLIGATFDSLLAPRPRTVARVRATPPRPGETLHA